MKAFIIISLLVAISMLANGSFAQSTKALSLQDKLNQVLTSFSKKVRTPISRNRTGVDRRANPGMRSTSDFAKYTHDMFETYLEFLTNNTNVISKRSNMKRSVPVGYTINCKLTVTLTVIFCSIYILFFNIKQHFVHMLPLHAIRHTNIVRMTAVVTILRILYTENLTSLIRDY